MPRDLIERAATSFGAVEIVQAALLERVQRTSFTWTQIPGAMCLATNRAYLAQALANPNVVAIVAPPAIAPAPAPEKALLLAERCAELFYIIHNLGVHLHAGAASARAAPEIGAGVQIAATAIVSPQASIGAGTVISDYCVIQGDVEIGADCVLQPFVTVGTEGFFSKNIGGRKTHVRHFGGVRIGANCILHTGTNVSRSVNFNESTELGDNVHVGIHCNIGHDCRVEENCDLAAWVLLLGRAVIGSGTWVGASSVVANAVTIGTGATVRIGAVVIEDVPDGGDVSGNFAAPHARNLKAHLRGQRK